MATAVDYSHDEIDPSSIQQPQSGYSHADIDPGSIQSPKETSGLDKTVPIIGGTPRGYIKSGLGLLPTAGMIGGAALATPADIVGGPLPTIAGSAVGGAAGNELKRLGEKYILGEEPSSGLEHAKETGEAALTGAGGEIGGQLLGRGAKFAAGTEYGQKALGLLGKGAAKIGELFTGVPEQEITTYAKNADIIKSMAKSSDNSTAEAADALREKFADSINKARQNANSELSQALSKSDKTISVKDTLDDLERSKQSLDPSLHSKDIDQIDDIINKITQKTKELNDPYSMSGSGKSASYSTGKSDFAIDPYTLEQRRLNPAEAGTPYTSSSGIKTTKPQKGNFNPLTLEYEESIPGSSVSKGISNKISSDAMDPLTMEKRGLLEAEQPTSYSKISSIPDKDILYSGDQMSVQDAHNLKSYMQGLVSDSYRKPGDIFTTGSGADRAIKSAAADIRMSINEAEPSVTQANNKLAKLHDIEDNMNRNLIAQGKPESALLAAGNGGNPRNAKALSELGNLTGMDMLGDAKNLAAMRTFGSPKLMATDATGKAVGRMGLASGIGYLTGGPAGAVGAAALTSPMALRTAIDAGRITSAQIKELMSTPAGRQMLSAAGRGLLSKDNQK